MQDETAKKTAAWMSHDFNTKERAGFSSILAFSNTERNFSFSI